MNRAVNVLFSLGLFWLFSVSAVAQAPTCEDCETYKHGVHRKVIPTSDFVCIYFIQPEADNVLLKLTLKEGGERSYQRPNAGKTGRICLGRHWVRRASQIIVCNGTASAYYEARHIAIVVDKPALSELETACLYGKKICQEKGFEVRK